MNYFASLVLIASAITAIITLFVMMDAYDQPYGTRHRRLQTRLIIMYTIIAAITSVAVLVVHTDGKLAVADMILLSIITTIFLTIRSLQIRFKGYVIAVLPSARTVKGVDNLAEVLNQKGKQGLQLRWVKYYRFRTRMFCIFQITNQKIEYKVGRGSEIGYRYAQSHTWQLVIDLPDAWEDKYYTNPIAIKYN